MLIVLPPSYPKNEYFASVTVIQKKKKRTTQVTNDRGMIMIWFNIMQPLK